MTVLMDDPTTYLTRDNDVPVVILAPNLAMAQFVARQYGVAIQVNGPDPTKGIRVVRNETEAGVCTTTLPKTTLWAVIPGGWSVTTYNKLFGYFGPPKTMDKALDVKTVGIAWRPEKTALI
jgi:hypothetical protein